MIQCELCGGSQFIKINGYFQCERCKTKYTPEEARKLFANNPLPAASGRPTAGVPASGTVKRQAPEFVVKGGILEAYNGTSPIVQIPAGVLAIGEECFIGKGIQKVIFPKTVSEIGYGAFSNCRRLTEAVLPDSVRIIWNYAFQNCVSLKAINFPNSLLSIGMGAFEGCSSITSIVVPNSVKEVMASAFRDCKSLRSATLPNRLENMGLHIFAGCTSLEPSHTKVPVPEQPHNNLFENTGFPAKGYCEFCAGILRGGRCKRCGRMQ